MKLVSCPLKNPCCHFAFLSTVRENHHWFSVQKTWYWDCPRFWLSQFIVMCQYFNFIYQRKKDIAHWLSLVGWQAIFGSFFFPLSSMFPYLVQCVLVNLAWAKGKKDFYCIVFWKYFILVSDWSFHSVDCDLKKKKLEIDTCHLLCFLLLAHSMIINMPLLSLFGKLPMSKSVTVFRWFEPNHETYHITRWARKKKLQNIQEHTCEHACPHTHPSPPPPHKASLGLSNMVVGIFQSHLKRSSILNDKIYSWSFHMKWQHDFLSWW